MKWLSTNGCRKWKVLMLLFYPEINTTLGMFWLLFRHGCSRHSRRHGTIGTSNWSHSRNALYLLTFISQFFFLIPFLLLDGGLWDFTADLRHGDTAYTNIALGAHTDTTYFVCRSPKRSLLFFTYHIFHPK